MPKLPKELQKKQKQKLDQLKKKTSGGQGTSARAMRRKLQQQGIEGMEEINALEVIIRCPDKALVIKNPNVIQLKQQGMTIHQVIGEPIEKELNELKFETTEEKLEEASGTQTQSIENEFVTNEENKPFSENDIILVATQAGVSQDEAKRALQETEGDLAKAILNLKLKK